jgi:hypothetical protein
MKISFFKTVYVIFILSALGCNNKPPLGMEGAFIAAGQNKNEVYSVIEHYSKIPGDSLKLIAAKFLIKNMADRYHYEGSVLGHYQEYIKLIRSDQEHGAYYMKSFNSLYGPFSEDRLIRVNDLASMKASDLIDNIDLAFAAREQYRWAKEVSFEDFCEYVLPYKIEDEVPDYNRAGFADRFGKLLAARPENNKDAVNSAIVINNALMFPKWILTQKAGFLPHFSSSQLLKYRTGSCRDMADLAIFAMRSVGIPVANDFLPQWPYRSMGHNWNVVLKDHAKPVMFLGAEDNPGTPHKPGTKKAKVFRYMFSRNRESLAMQPDKDAEIAPLFNDARLKDVTSQYVPCFNPDIALINPNEDQRRFAYLGVFDNADWIPVQWGRINNGKVQFRDMEGGIVYLPGYYSNNALQGANDPFLLDSLGKVRFLKPDKKKLQRMELSRVFPIIPDLFWVHALVGGVFQGANSPDFSDAVTIDSIAMKPFPFWNEVPVRNQGKFRYVRYLSSSGGHCDIGELEFYQGKVKLKGEIIGSAGSYNNSDRTREKAMDGDITTFFDAKMSSGAWVGLDLGKSQRIDLIRFSAATEEARGYLTDGHHYELFYWENQSQWISAGVKSAKNGKVIFDKTPSNALYRLHDLDKEQSERVFIYDKRQQWY